MKHKTKKLLKEIKKSQDTTNYNRLEEKERESIYHIR